MMNPFAGTKSMMPVPDAVQALYPLSLSNSLTGYVYRSVEEFVTDRKSAELSPTERECLLTSLYEEAEQDLKDSCYKALNRNDELDGRILFCLALRWRNRHLKYLLADDEQQGCWYFNALQQNIEGSIRCHERAYKALFPDADIASLMERKQDAIRENTEQDVFFGYIVKLSESLHPY
jgi:hypothetical protein